MAEKAKKYKQFNPVYEVSVHYLVLHLCSQGGHTHPILLHRVVCECSIRYTYNL